MFFRFFFFFILFLITGPCALQSAFAQSPKDPESLHKILNEKQKQFDELEAFFASGNEIDTQILHEKREKIKELRSELQAQSVLIKPLYEEILADLKDLGPAPQPVEGVPFVPEPENIQKLRTQLNEESSAFEGLTIQADALISKSLRLQERIVTLRRDKFLSRILEKQPPPFAPELWTAAKENLDAQHATLVSSLESIQQENPSYTALIAAIFAFIAVLIAARAYSLRSLNQKIAENPQQGQESKFAKASLSSLVSMVITLVGFSFIHQSFMAQGVIHEHNFAFFNQLILLSCFLIFAFIVTARLAVSGIVRPVTKWLSCFVAFLYVSDQIALELGRTFGAAVEIAVLQSYFVTSIFAVVIFIGSLFAFRACTKGMRFLIPAWGFLFFAGVGVFLLAANLFGYAALTRVVFERFVVLSSFLIFMLMVRSVGRSFLRQIDGIFQKPDPEADKEEERLLLFWLSLTLDLIIFSLSLPLAAGLIGVDWLEVQDWATHVFWGFSIGNVNISLAKIGIGLSVFLVLLFFTRVLQRVLKEKILPKTRLDSSIRQSLVQILGYLGLCVSMMAGVSALGFDLSNLALIAGALSVGIGFGLQSIVGNFVSGLILLFERPIKVGDWVILNSGEGIVKKISVRATEIEAFDRTSIIVPNSELIASAVKNWNYKDRIGRVVIPVGVSYKSDPRRVREILLECAKEHPSVLSHPPTSVYFKDFGDNALLFDLRLFIRNIRDMYDVATDLRLMIWDRFKEENIEIPFPQSDLHINPQEFEKMLELFSSFKTGKPQNT